jgi:hypothetical protein
MAEPAPGPHDASTIDRHCVAAPIPRNVKVLGGVSLAQDTGSEMIYQLLPTLVTGVLGAPVVALAVAEGLADATASVMKPVAGRLTTARRRRPWIAAGYALASVGKLVVVTAIVWPFVLAGRVVDRIGKGVRGVPRDALIADEADDATRGRAFGFHRSCDTTGAVIGSLLGLGLYHAVGGRIRVALAVALGPALVSVALVAPVRERLGPRASSTPTRRTADQRSRRPSGPRWHRCSPSRSSTRPMHCCCSGPTSWGSASPRWSSPTCCTTAYTPRSATRRASSPIGSGRASCSRRRGGVRRGAPRARRRHERGGGVGAAADVRRVRRAHRRRQRGLDRRARRTGPALLGARRARGEHGAAIVVAGVWSGLAWGGDDRLPLVVSGIAACGVAMWLLLAARRQDGANSPRR